MLRDRSGLSQSELAERAGTSRTRLSAYEHGHTDPGLATLNRIATGAGLEITIAARGTRQVAAHIEAIAAALRDDDSNYALRLVAELTDWVRHGVVGFWSLLSDPGSTGDARWDALIGGVTEILAHEQSRPVPPWASAPSRFLPTWWFVTSLRSLRASVFVETPGPLAARGVLLSASSLGSV